MVRPPFMLGSKGFVPTNIYNIEMCDMQVTRKLFKEIMGREHSYYRWSDELPVDSVAWYDCIKFCNKLSELLGFEAVYEIDNEEWDHWNNIVQADVTWDEKANGFRLPTEQEWEAFAKAGTENRWSGTDDYEKVYNYAWLFDNSGYENHVVGSKKPNEWGLYDMTGNVSEWCWDEVGDEGYKDTKGGDQRSGSHIRITERSPSPPSLESHITGFRICRTIE
jgi:formylglycine-generating enzyme required for sulfatase activity